MPKGKLTGELKQTTSTKSKHAWIKAAREVIEELGELLDRLTEIFPVLEKFLIRLIAIVFLALAFYAVVSIKASSLRQNPAQAASSSNVFTNATKE